MVRTIVRAGLCAALTLAIGSVSGCSSSSHGATPAGPTTTAARSTPPDVAPSPAELHLEPASAFIAFVDTEYGDRSASRWYLGFGEGRRGQTVVFDVDALAATSDEASRYCAEIAGAAAYFMQGRPYALAVAGQIKVASAANPGVITFQHAKFTPVSCPKPGGAPADPMRANEPRTSSDAIDRLVRFVGNYYDRVGTSGPNSWYGGIGYGGIGTKIMFLVNDRTAALGIKRCDTMRPLALWILGPFARQFTPQVRGSSSTGSTSWPAVDCPA